MSDQKTELLLIEIARLLCGEKRDFFTLHEMAWTIDDNQRFYQRLHLENIRRLAYYRRAQFLSNAATIITLGLYLFFYKVPQPPHKITADSIEVASKPDTLLPEAVYYLTIGHSTKILTKLVEKEFLIQSGEYPGIVYYPTEKLWEVDL